MSHQKEIEIDDETQEIFTLEREEKLDKLADELCQEWYLVQHCSYIRLLLEELLKSEGF